MKDKLAAPLTHLFNKSLREHVVPDTWKTANVTPVFKMKGSKYKTDNYRPISLTSICCTLMESQIKNAITKHLDQNDIIKDSQHGFTTRRSAVTNLLEYLEKVTSNVDQGKPVDVIYLDLSKAFYKVQHRRLIKILQDYKIDKEVIQWIKIWLNERKQRVVLNGKKVCPDVSLLYFDIYNERIIRTGERTPKVTSEVISCVGGDGFSRRRCSFD